MASPSPIPRRLLLPLLGLVAVVVALLWWPQPQNGQGAGPQESTSPDLTVAGQFAAAPEARGLQRTDAREDELERSADQTAEDLLQPYIEVRFWVTTSHEEVPGFAPSNAETWTAVAQIWFEQTGETKRIEMPFSSYGKATFRFWEDTHVDWFAAIPPKSNAYGFDRHEDHTDYTLGDREDLFLQVGLGGTLQGRVTDLEGKLLAGVPVQLMHDNGPALDFVPGYLQTETNAQGQFHFPRLAEGNTWTVAVPPGEWLMINPTFGEIDYGAGMADVSAEPLPADVGTLVVTRGATVDLQVVDSLGNGVPGIFVDVLPVQYFDSQFRPPDPEDFGLGEEPIEATDTARQAFLHGESVVEDHDWGMEEEWDSNLRDDPYAYDYGFMTGKDGHATLHLLPGRYIVNIEDYPGQYELPEIQHGPIQVPFSTEQQSLQVALPITVGTIRGRLLDLDEQAVAYATINIYNEYQDIYVQTDQEGRFVGNSLSMNMPAVVELWDGGDDDRTFTDSSWAILPSVTPVERTFYIQDAINFWVYLAIADGRKLPANARLRLLDWAPTEDTPPAVDPDWLRQIPEEIDLGNGAAASFGNLLRGTAEVALILPDPMAGIDARGKPVRSYIEFQRWTLPVDDSLRQVKVDLGSYREPQPQQTHYRVKLRNAKTGKTDIVAVLHATMEEPRTTHAVQSQTGELSFTTRKDRVFVRVLAHGYRPYQEWWPANSKDEVERIVTLIPEDSRLFLHLVDSEGHPLPDCQVNLFAADGTTPLFADVEPNTSYVSQGTSGYLVNGRLALRMVPSGRMLLRPDLFGYRGASAWVEVPQVPAGARMTVAVDQSLAEIRQEILFLDQEE